MKVDEIQGDATVIIHLSEGGDNVHVRDFRTVVKPDTSGWIVLGEATTELSDTVSNDKYVPTGWDYSRYQRSWAFDWSKDNIKTSIYVLIKGNSLFSMKLDELVALKEKEGNRVVSPTLEINGTNVTFTVNGSPVVLSTSPGKPYLLRYNGQTGNCRLYTDNYESAGLCEASILMGNRVVVIGTNEIRFLSSGDPAHSQRVNLRLTVTDDQDGDGIPTNGDYRDCYTPCSPGNYSYCDDNQPNVPNPSQDGATAEDVAEPCLRTDFTAISSFVSPLPWSKQLLEQEPLQEAHARICRYNSSYLSENIIINLQAAENLAFGRLGSVARCGEGKSQLRFGPPSTFISACIGQPVYFSNGSSQHAVRFLWDFGDGEQSVEECPVHVYNTVGTYAVSLTMWLSEGRSITLQKKDYVIVH